jgi:hypothetical protein
MAVHAPLSKSCWVSLLWRGSGWRRDSSESVRGSRRSESMSEPEEVPSKEAAHARALRHVQSRLFHFHTKCSRTIITGTAMMPMVV